jgi:hypothetical protein
MNLSHLRLGSVRPASVSAPRRRALRGQTPFFQQPLSRRRFLGAVAGAAGLALGWRPGVARADGPGDPIPISPCLFGEFDVCAPALIGNANQNPITITDFSGFVGLAYISGMADEYDANSGRYIQTLPFLDSDMRFTSRLRSCRLPAGTPWRLS